MIASDQILSKLENWYQSQCNGDWEHQYGVKIDCIDNPGWAVCVDLKETLLEYREMPALLVDNGENDWMHCKVENTQFVGYGDPKKLQSIIEVFLQFAGGKDSRTP